MANRTYLMNHESGAPRTAAEIENTCLLGANYQLPILWLALFDQDDLTTVPVACTNGAGDQIIENIPTLFTSTAKAKATYASRRTALVQALGAECVPYIAEWESFISSNISAPSVQVDLVELWMMYDNPPDFAVDIREWLSGVSASVGAQWNSLCSQASFGDAAVRRYGIRGFPWQAKLAWS